MFEKWGSCRRRLGRLDLGLAVVAVIVVAVASFEWQRPYFFLQDDNRDYFLPAFVHNVRAVAEGQLPLYNFHQSLGRPHLAVGQTAALHPLPYLAVFLSDTVLGHSYATVDILVLLYLIIGGCGMLAAAQAIGLPRAAALLAALSWPLLPFNVHVSQSWAVHPPLVAFFPWMVHGVLTIGGTRRAVVELVAIQVLFFYAGHPQPFIYAAIFQAALLAGIMARPVESDSATARVVLRRYAGAWTATLVFILPLLVPMWGQVLQSAYRADALSLGAFMGGSLRLAEYGNGVAFPFARLYDIPKVTFFLDEVPASFTHVGYVATFLAAVWLAIRRAQAPSAMRWRLTVAAVLAFVAVLWATGVLSLLLYWLPVLNRFRWPFRAHAFAAFFLLILAAGGFAWILGRERRRITVVLIIVVQVANLWLLDLRFPKHGFLEHLDPVPLHEPLASQLRNGRYVSIGYELGRPRIHTAATLGFNYATLWGLQGFGGYEPLVGAGTLAATLGLDYHAILNAPPGQVPVAYLRSWGVRWYVLNRPWEPVHRPQLERSGLVLRAADSRRLLFEDPRAPDLAQSLSGECTRRSAWRFPGDDVEAVLDCDSSTEVVLSFLYTQGLHVRVDGNRVPILGTTALGQPIVAVPKGEHTVGLEYDEDLLKLGLILTGLVTLVGGVLLLLRSNRPPISIWSHYNR